MGSHLSKPTWLAFLTLTLTATSFAAEAPRCVVYFKHAFETPIPAARKLAAKVDKVLASATPMRLAEPLKTDGEFCPAHFEKFTESSRLKTGQKELAVIRWFGPTERSELEFALEYFVYDQPLRRRIRKTGGFAIQKSRGTEADLDQAAKTVTDVVVVGPNI